MCPCPLVGISASGMEEEESQDGKREELAQSVTRRHLVVSCVYDRSIHPKFHVSATVTQELKSTRTFSI